MRKSHVLATIILLTISSLTVGVSAQDSTSLGYSPSAVYPVLKPGETYSGKVSFWNTGDTSRKYDVLVRGIRSVNDQPGTAIPLDEKQDSLDIYSASKWVEVDITSFELAPQTTVEVKYTLTVPSTALSGGYYASVMAIGEHVDTSDLTGSVSTASLLGGTVIIIRVEGGEAIQEQAKLLDFTTDSEYYIQGSTRFLTTLENSGNVHLFPTGTIRVKNIFGQQVAEIDFNPQKGTLLRSTTATFETDWIDGFLLNKNRWLLLGPVTAELVAVFASHNPGFSGISAQTTFWLLPWPVFLLPTLIIAGISIRKYHKNKHHG